MTPRERAEMATASCDHTEDHQCASTADICACEVCIRAAIASAERDALERAAAAIETERDWAEVHYGESELRNGALSSAAEIVRALADLQPRRPGCRCHLEEGDSPCPIHGEKES
jgi:hypothetical protein